MNDLSRLAVLTQVRKARLAAAERRLAEAAAKASRARAFAAEAEEFARVTERRGLAQIQRERDHLFTVKFTVPGVSELRATVSMVQADIATRHQQAVVAEDEAVEREEERRAIARDLQIQRAKVERLEDEVRSRRRQLEEHRDSAEVSEFAERAKG